MRRLAACAPLRAPHTRDPLAAWLAGLSRSALVVATGWVSSPAAGVDLVYDLPEDIVAVASDDPALDSVLVGTRAGEPLDAAEAPELEPISEVSPYEPELADPPEENTPPATATPSADEAEAQAGSEERRYAALPTDGTAALKEAASTPSKGGPSPAKFHGVVPGESTRERLVEHWGEPDSVAPAKGETRGGEVLTYHLAPFERVEVLVEEGTVAVIRVSLGEDAPLGEMVDRLRLEKVEPVEVADPASGGVLAMTYPEKGLTLLTRPAADAASAEVTHLVLEPLDVRAFILRGERRDPGDVRGRLRDLQRAVEAAPQDARAHWLKAQQHLAAGHAAAALSAAQKAIEIEPGVAAHRLTLAESLLDAAEYDRAVLETRRVLDDSSAPAVVRAGALDLMGRLAALGDAKIAGKAIDFHTAAIELADGLATSEDVTERRLAKDLLVSSHLAVAREVARREYDDKVATVAEWIGRASGIAEERIASDEGSLLLRLRVAREALAALAQLRPTKDPAPWVKEAEETAAALLADSDDNLHRCRVHWELGEAYLYAVRVEHQRGDADRALAYGAEAIEELSEGAAPRTTSPAAERLVGELYFYLGAVNAVHRQNHEEATGWYDKARDILVVDQPDSEFVVPRRDGEQLVSMGVSYWNQGQQDLAVELTESGARLMERAVSAGVLGDAELAVPYGNLATMHKKLDRPEKALDYERLAKGVQESLPAATPTATAPPATKRTASDQAAATVKPGRPAATTAEPATTIPKPNNQASRRVTPRQAPPAVEQPRVGLGRPTARRTVNR